MPRCESRPGAVSGSHVPCPAGRNDSSVHNTQGDLMLCKACEEFRFPTAIEIRSSKAQKRKTETSTSIAAGASTDLATDTADVSEATASQPNTKLVVSELLSYVCYHRNSCSQSALLSVITSYYTPAEITAAKKCLIGLFREVIDDCAFTVERRTSTSRPAHEAEADDITAVIDYLEYKCIE